MPVRRDSGAPEAELIVDDHALARLVEELVSEPRYALDTEFSTEGTYWPKLALVQIAWAGGIAIIDPLACDVKLLAPVLFGPGQMVAHAAQTDLEILERVVGAGPRSLFDTQIASGFVGLGTPSLGWLVGELLGLRLDKTSQLSDWTRRPLSDSELSYAARDVAWLLALADRLGGELEARGRMSWADDEFSRLLATDRRAGDPETAWWRLRGSRTLRPAVQGVAQSVYAWRERTARALDRPARFILGDLALAAIVAKPPADIAQLRALRGVGSLRRNLEDALLAAIEEGRELEADVICRPEGLSFDSDLDPALRLLAAWSSQRANELGIEPALFATRADIEALIAGRDGRLTQSWRAELFGEPARKLLSGETVVRLAEGGRRLEVIGAGDAIELAVTAVA